MVVATGAAMSGGRSPYSAAGGSVPKWQYPLGHSVFMINGATAALATVALVWR